VNHAALVGRRAFVAALLRVCIPRRRSSFAPACFFFVGQKGSAPFGPRSLTAVAANEDALHDMLDCSLPHASTGPQPISSTSRAAVEQGFSFADEATGG
jgi:hypothetical protein